MALLILDRPVSKGDRQQKPDHRAEAAFDAMALAASAGGVTALGHVLSTLPEHFPAAVVVVQHLDPRHRSLMADILSRRTPLQVTQAKEGALLCPGTVYIAPHFVRPSADLLFESLAASYEERAIAVVLTETGSDGAMGVKAIKKMGGTVIVQDEQSSEFFGMPSAAIKTGDADFVLPLHEIRYALETLVMKGMVA